MSAISHEAVSHQVARDERFHGYESPVFSHATCKETRTRARWFRIGERVIILRCEPPHSRVQGWFPTIPHSSIQPAAHLVVSSSTIQPKGSYGHVSSLDLSHEDGDSNEMITPRRRSYGAPHRRANCFHYYTIA